MTVRKFAIAAILVVPFLVAWAPGDPLRDGELASRAVNLKAMEKITASPVPMEDETARLCDSPARRPDNVHRKLLGTVYCDVYVNKTAHETMLAGSGTFPVGSLIVKAKLHPKSEESGVDDLAPPTFFTVMRKREAGYDADHGDWEYAVVELENSPRLLARGKIDSCIACHERHKETDFVTRVYMKE